MPHRYPAVVRVAVIGSGLAGLTAAYLLSQNEKIECHLYERKSTIGMDCYSLDIKNESGETKRVDVPMRAFAAGHYSTLIRLYRQLDITFKRERFAFSFGKGAFQESYVMYHGSGGLRGFRSTFSTWQTIQIAWGYIYFSFLALVLYISNIRPSSSLEEFCDSTRLPRIFRDELMFPMFCALCTCNREEIAKYPAAQILEYKARSTFRPHYSVARGVTEVVKRLTSSVRHIHLNQEVSYNTKGAVYTLSGSSTFDYIIDASIPPAEIPLVETTVLTHEDNSFFLPNDPSQINIWHNLSTTVATHRIAKNTYQTTIDSRFLRNIEKPKRLLSESSFRRARHTTLSQNIIAEYLTQDGTLGRRQGIGGVFYIGSWCYHGIPLLEGCVWSAACIANAIQEKAGIEGTAARHKLL